MASFVQVEIPEPVEYDEYDAAADAMDDIGPDDVAAIMAEDNNHQPADEAPMSARMPSSAALVNLPTRLHHQYTCDMTSTGDSGLTVVL